MNESLPAPGEKKPDLAGENVGLNTKLLRGLNAEC
jgi:hypothetical protein